MTLHVSDSISVHHQESSTVRTAIRICHTGYADCLLAESVWKIQNKFEKLVLLGGFIIRLYHEARSCECQIKKECLI